MTVRRREVAFSRFQVHVTEGPDQAATAQDWPGNVRELRGAVERAVLMGDPEAATEMVTMRAWPLQADRSPRT
jgi:DNA-binding NtrC family response regulator